MVEITSADDACKAIGDLEADDISEIADQIEEKEFEAASALCDEWIELLNAVKTFCDNQDDKTEEKATA